MITLMYALCLFGSNNCGVMVPFPIPFKDFINCQQFIHDVLIVEDRPPVSYRFMCQAST
jgi:hypothetical protein